jgi:uncharacterized protein (TIGR02217 family)
VEVPLYPSLPTGALSVEVRYRTELAEFDAGYQVRLARWARPRRKFSIAYDILMPAEWQSILDLYHRQQGGLREFRFDDFSDTAPLARTFGLGDGTTTVFWLQHDYTLTPVIRIDGAPYAGVYVDPDTGRVQFDAAPARDAVLTYDAVSAGYRVRFSAEVLAYNRLAWGAFSQTIEMEQVSDQQDIYPIRQVVCGGTIATLTLDEIGDGIAFSFVCPKDLTVTDVSYYVADLLDSGQVRAAICADEDGAPGAELGSTDDFPGAFGWQTVTLAAPVDLVRGGRYWLTVVAHGGTWDGTHWIDVQYTSAVPNPIPGEDQDDILYGAYAIQDGYCLNTPHSWLGVSLRAAGGAWSTRDPAAHGAFFLNHHLPEAGHCQAPMTQEVYDLTHTREMFTTNTIHDIIIDRIGSVFSTNGAPAEDLHYAIIFGAGGGGGGGVVQQTGVLCSPIDTAGVPTYMETILWAPLTIPSGTVVQIAFWSTTSVIGAPWTHWGHFDSWSDYSESWEADWDWIRWAGTASRAKISIDGGLTYPTEIMGAWTVRCRGVWKP